LKILLEGGGQELNTILVGDHIGFLPFPFATNELHTTVQKEESFG
jgi:hypothetical protein